MRSSEHIVATDYRQFLVHSGNSPVITPETTGDQGDGLAVVSDGGLRVITGTQYGSVLVRIEIYDDEPELPSADWTEVSDVSFRLRAGPLELGTLDGEPVPDSPDLAFAGPGWYRIRIASQGRDQGAKNPVAEEVNPHERYLIAVWASPGSPAESLRRFDRFGRSFRGGNRSATEDRFMDSQAVTGSQVRPSAS